MFYLQQNYQVWAWLLSHWMKAEIKLYQFLLFTYLFCFCPSTCWWRAESWQCWGCAPPLWSPCACSAPPCPTASVHSPGQTWHTLGQCYQGSGLKVDRNVFQKIQDSFIVPSYSASLPLTAKTLACLSWIVRKVLEIKLSSSFRSKLWLKEGSRSLQTRLVFLTLVTFMFLVSST